MTEQFLVLLFAVTLVRHAVLASTFLEASEGDYTIGGLFRVNAFKGECLKDEISEAGIKQMEAFRYAVREVNRMGILPNGTTLGYRIHNACKLPMTQSTREMDLTYLCDDMDMSSISNGTIIAIAGAISSYAYSAIKSEQYLCTPIVSSLATAYTFGDVANHPYFFRTIPSDEYQATALVNVAKNLGHRRGILLYEDRVYAGGLKRNVLQTVEKDPDFCLSVVKLVNQRTTNWTKLFSEIEIVAEEQTTSAVFALFGFNCAAKLFSELETYNSTNGFVEKLQFFGPDSWIGSKNTPKNKFSVRSLGTQLYRTAQPGFDRYVRNLTVKTSENYMFRRLIAEQNNCSLVPQSNLPICNGTESLRYLETDDVHLTIEAVSIVAHALTKSLSRQKFSGWTFRQILSHTFVNDSLANFHFFNKTNGGSPRYAITQLQKHPNGSYIWTAVGRYSPSGLNWKPSFLRPELKITAQCYDESESNCDWKCYRFYMATEPEAVLLSVIGFISFLATMIFSLTLYEVRPKRVETLWSSNMPFVNPLLLLACCGLFLCTLLSWLPYNLACVINKALVSLLWAVGSTALAMKAQGTRRARAGIFECLGLFTRNIRAAVLAQLLVIFLVHILLLAIWFSLNMPDRGDILISGAYYSRRCSLFGPSWRTLFIYAVPVCSAGVSIVYSISLITSSEPYLIKEGNWLLISALGFLLSLVISVVLSFAGLYFNSVRIFSTTNFIACISTATSLLFGQGCFKSIEITGRIRKAEKMQYSETNNRYELAVIKPKTKHGVDNERESTDSDSPVIVKAYSSEYDYPELSPIQDEPYSRIQESNNPYSEMPAKSSRDGISTTGYSCSDVKSPGSVVTSAYSTDSEVTENLALFMEKMPERQKLTLQMITNSGLLGKHGALVIESPSGEEELRLTRRDLDTLIEGKEGDLPTESGTYASIETPDSYKG